jgi:hypothetical protein
MKKLILIIILSCFIKANAQVPGYQGKRLLVSYNIGIGSSLLSNLFISGEAAPSLNLSFDHIFDAEYVLGRRFSLEGEYSFTKSRYTQSDQTTPATLNSSAIGINCVFYPVKDNSLAPVGSCFKLKLFSRSYSVAGPVTGTDSLGNNYTYNGKATGHMFGIGVSFAYHHIIKNRILFSASLDGDLNILSSLSNDPLNGNAQDNLLSSYLAYIKFGVGGLLF